MSRSIRQSDRQFVKQAVSQSIRQSSMQPVNQSVNQSVNQTGRQTGSPAGSQSTRQAGRYTGLIHAIFHDIRALRGITGVDLSKIFGVQSKILGGKVVKSDKCMGVSQLLGAGARAAPSKSTPMRGIQASAY